jgi:hypothetical protein
VTGVVSVTGATALTGDMGLTGDLNVTGATALTGDMGLTGDLNVTGATALTGVLNANGGIDSNDTLLLDAYGVLELNSSAGAIGIGNDAVSQAINVGTGGAARTITMGNATGSTTVNIHAGSGNVNITGNLLPTTDILYDIGSPTHRIKDIYVENYIAAGGGITGDTVIGGTLAVTGALNANGGITCDTDKFTVADATGDTVIGGTLAVTGALNAANVYADNIDTTALKIGSTTITSTATELNILDGDTSAISTTIVDADQIILNDNGTMKQVPVTNLDTYIKSTLSITTLTDCLAGGASIWIGSDPIASLVNSGFSVVQNYNTGVGIQALDAITDGNSNVGVGYNALTATTVGLDNVGIGSSALFSMVGGQKNIGIGTDALRLATSNQNIGIGHAAGNGITSGTANILIGYNTDADANNGTNQIVIGDSATCLGDNKVVIGNSSITDVHMSQDSGAVVHCGGLTVTSGGDVAHDEAVAPFFTLAVNNHRRGRYTLTTDAIIADDAHSSVFTVQNNITTADDIILMQCTSNHVIEMHPFNVSATGWDFIIVNRTGSPLAADTVLVLNFLVIS